MDILMKLFPGVFPKKVPQTGLIIRPPSPTDRLAGATIKEVRLSNGIWSAYRPSQEKQYAPTFDTMSCASFSANNVVEYQINWMLQNGKISDELKAWLNSNGYLENGICNLSDRFTAIMSGTTKQGNFFQAVWDAIRNVGVIPERVFPFGGTTWEEYHDATLITPAMKALGLEWKKRFDTEYEWITYDNEPTFNQGQVDLCKNALRFGPLHIAIPVPATHAVTLETIQAPTLTIFDQYPPYTNINQIDYPIHYAMTGYVSLKPQVPARTLREGMSGNDVKELQNSLITLKFLVDVADGKFGPKTKAAVIFYQRAKGLVADGIAGKLTQASIADSLKKKSDIAKFKLVPELEEKALRFLDLCLKYGFSVYITEGFRSMERQQELYNQGRTTPGPIVTNAKPGQSAHNFGKAFDIAFTGSNPYPNDDGKWKACADLGRAVGLVPGYYYTSFKDRPHYNL